jgi:hypothetical protein
LAGSKTARRIGDGVTVSATSRSVTDWADVTTSIFEPAW